MKLDVRSARSRVTLACILALLGARPGPAIDDLSLGL